MNRPAEPPTRVHLRAYGTVQGVGFREFVRSAAHRLGVAGHVRNRRDGAVEVEAGGAAEAVRRLRELVAQGPPHARVSRLEELTPTDGPLNEPFAILRTSR
jgi:acylphosphatase